MLPLALLLLAATVWQGEAQQLPTHWSSDLPDGFSSSGGVFAVAVSVAGACAALAGLATVLSLVLPAFWGRWIIALLAGIAATAAATYGSAALGTHLAGSPQRVHVVWALAPFVLGLLWGLVAYLLHRPEKVDRQAVIDTVPERARVVPLPAGEVSPWATSVRSGVLLGTAIFVAVVCGVSAVLAGSSSVWAGLLVGLIAVLAAAYTAAWARVEVRADSAGLTIRSQLLPLTLTRIEPDEIVGVQTLDLDPMKWGGIGLRWLPGSTAYVVRGGPGVVVHRASGRRFAVEITEGEPVAEAGARTLLQVAGHAARAAQR